MLGYLAIYGGQYSELVRRQSAHPRRWWHHLMPHQICGMN